ncbi:MAG TPA: hypothetical protein VFF73_41245 [Planctomycetota bacterium]|nr:hypothetical protein [Planctomycetota bacterium]
MHETRLFDAALGLLLGGVLGASFFLALRANTRLYLGTGVGAAPSLHVARLLGTAGAFLAVAILLPAALIPALFGFTVAGLAASLRAARETAP